VGQDVAGRWRSVHVCADAVGGHGARREGWGVARGGTMVILGGVVTGCFVDRTALLREVRWLKTWRWSLIVGCSNGRLIALDVCEFGWIWDGRCWRLVAIGGEEIEEIMGATQPLVWRLKIVTGSLRWVRIRFRPRRRGKGNGVGVAAGRSGT